VALASRVDNGGGADVDGRENGRRGTPTVYERLSSVFSCEWSTPQHKFAQGVSVYGTESGLPRAEPTVRGVSMAYLGRLPSARVGPFTAVFDTTSATGRGYPGRLKNGGSAPESIASDDFGVRPMSVRLF
jgi:hypothetical protein